MRSILLTFTACLILLPVAQAQTQPRRDSLQAVWRDGQAADSSRFQALKQLAGTAPTPEATRSWLRQLTSWAETQAYREAQVWGWRSLASSYDNSGDPDSARAVLDDALTRTQAWQDAGSTAKIQRSLAVLSYRQGNFAEADRRYQAVIDKGPPLQVAAAWRGKGNVAYRQARFTEAKSAYLQALRVQQQLGKEASDLGGSWFNLALALGSLGQQDSALLAYEQARAYALKKQQTKVLGYVYNSLAGIYAEQGNYPRALACADSSLKMAESSGSLIGQAQAKEAMSRIYTDQEEGETAVAYARASLALYQQAGEQAPIAQAYNALGNIWNAFEQTDSALVAFQHSLEIAESLDLKGLICGLAVNIGNVYHLQGEHQTAISYLEKGLSLSRDLGYQEYEVNALGSLAQAHSSLGAHGQAVAFGERALALARQLGLLRQVYTIYDALATAYEALGRPTEALSHYRTYVELRDSLKSEENQRAVIRYEYQQQNLQDSLAFVQEQADTELAYQSQLNQRNLLLFGAALLLLVGALGFLYFRYRQQQRSRERERELALERERKEQLTELDRLKSRFFANISHELRTPLTLILGQNQSLQAELDDPRVDAKFDMVDRNARRLMELVNQVLDLSKLESGRLELNVQTFDLISFMKNMLFSFESLADQKRQQLLFQSREENLLIVADPEKLERVFFNLLSNAVKFTPEAGSITVKVQMVAHRVHVGVIDTGVGIPAEQQSEIFDRFYQAEAGTNHPSPGSGIGLALVKELVGLHQGQVQVDSTPGKGSAFWITLPLNAGIASEAAAPYEPRLEPLELATRTKTISTKEFGTKKSQPSGEERILIVEDNPDVRSFLKQELENIGYTVLEAEDGQVGLAQAKAHQPDLIISDVMMPKMDGFELAQAIRADASSSHVPLILLTAKGSEESRITGLETGVDDYLTKPFNTRELQARVANLIAQRKRLQEKFATALTIKPEEVSAVPMDQQFLQKVTDSIEAHLTDEQFGIDLLAEEAGISVTHLNRKLKALIGQTAGKLIRSMRLQRAADLLQQGAGNVSDIGYELCFSDSANFARAFKAQFGVTPSQYREEGKK